MNSNQFIEEIECLEDLDEDIQCPADYFSVEHLDMMIELKDHLIICEKCRLSFDNFLSDRQIFDIQTFGKYLGNLEENFQICSNGIDFDNYNESEITDYNDHLL